ncbi:hypothetical protein Ctob_000508 [Chrysochromulina tobinii]|uniref:DUS-like FMN-binding domain-containing protein n=1 Tax=Chrysochromulina tobinii TaxID=1460289 RepID=A0A0M0J3T6_9EUKA|nr:hypothetical protein Ctob_000508 [Chrysochromulina tobinii]|eukprot:KOO21251.1 hypothetical protein Ctob_000508 [Chrysochromulina sp. CCMP291]
MVYSEEIVDRCLSESKRVVNAALGTVDFESNNERGGGRVVFRTTPNERVVLQLGTASGPAALLAAQVAAADVRAIDINMGCPVKFSVQGGMGSALLSQPERIRDILTTLRRNLPASMPLTCKIRLLDATQETIELAKLIESCGVSALAVHARRRHDRPRHWAQWDQFAILRETLPRSLPVILNGDVFAPEDVPRALAITGADSLMLARGALWNPSIFRSSSLLVDGWDAECVKRYFELGEATQCPLGNLKYTAMLMLEGAGKLEPFRLIQSAKTLADLHAAAAACAAHPHFTQPGGAFCPAILEPPPDLPAAIELTANSWRRKPNWWKPGASLPTLKPGEGRYKATKQHAKDVVGRPDHWSGAEGAPVPVAADEAEAVGRSDAAAVAEPEDLDEQRPAKCSRVEADSTDVSRGVG